MCGVLARRKKLAMAKHLGKNQLRSEATISALYYATIKKYNGKVARKKQLRSEATGSALCCTTIRKTYNGKVPRTKRLRCEATSSALCCATVKIYNGKAIRKKTAEN